jgi:hypothetical protein
MRRVCSNGGIRKGLYRRRENGELENREEGCHYLSLRFWPFLTIMIYNFWTKACTNICLFYIG